MRRDEEAESAKPEPLPSSGGLAERLLIIGKNCAARLKEPYRSADHGDLLYDTLGLSR